MKKVQPKTIDERFDKLENLIEGLAMSTLEGFSGIDKKFVDIDEKITKKFDYLSNRVDDLAMNRATREQIKFLEIRIEKLEKKVLSK